MKYSLMYVCSVEENVYTSIWQTGRATCELPDGLCMMGVRCVSHPLGLSLLAVCWAPSHLRVFEGVVMSQLHSAWAPSLLLILPNTGRLKLEWMDRTVSLVHSCILPSSLSPSSFPTPCFLCCFLAGGMHIHFPGRNYKSQPMGFQEMLEHCVRLGTAPMAFVRLNCINCIINTTLQALYTSLWVREGLIFQCYFRNR